MIEIILAIFIFLITGINIFRLIQIKEYFFPSLWAHFDYPSSFRLFINKKDFLFLFFWLITLFFSIFFGKIIISEKSLNLFLILIFILFIKRHEQIHLINWTPKAWFIVLLTLLINARLISLSNYDISVFFLLLTNGIQFTILIFSTYLANVLTNFYSIFLFRKAENKIKKWLEKDKKRIVIGITGSYGKTSTKEILSHLLSYKYRVLKSPQRLNAEIGLAQFINNQDLENYDCLVLELGARQMGEIKKMINIFHPNITFLTGLAPQHIATFGSMENIIKGKLEIFQSPNLKLAFLNGSNEKIKEIFKELNLEKKYLYAHPDGDFYSKNEIYSLERTEFDFVYPEGEIRLKTNLIGPMVENIIGALACCYCLEIKPNELKDKLTSFNLLPHQFQIIKKSNPLIIDDSYNANIVGVQKALDFFYKIPLRKRYVFFAGILELGVETEDIYSKILESFKDIDKLIITFKDFSEIFTNKLKNKVIIYNHQDIKELIEDENKEDIGILILGRIPNNLLEKLISLQ